MRSHTKRAWPVVVAGVLLLTACGNGEDADPTDDVEATPDDVTADEVELDEEPYTIGLNSSQTGPLAPAYGTNLDGFEAYVRWVNATGGINGHPVELLVEDDGSDAAEVASNVRRFLGEDVHLLVTATASHSYEPMIGAATEDEIPVVLGGGAGCPGAVLPPEPHPWLFCTSAGVAEVDGPVAAHLLRQLADEEGVDEINVGLVALDVPVSRSEVERVAEIGPDLGLNVVETAVVPRGAQDFGPFATQLNQADVDFVFAWAPWSTEAGVFQALDELGWEGTYLSAIQPPAEADMAATQNENLYAFYARGFVADGTPGVDEMIEAADAGGITSDPATWVDGWLSAKAIGAAFEACGWPCGSDDLRGAFEQINVDTGGLTGSPMQFSADNHFAFDSWKVYRWDDASEGLIGETDWITFGGLGPDEPVEPLD